MEDGNGRGGEGRSRNLLEMLREAVALAASVTDEELEEASEAFERAKVAAQLENERRHQEEQNRAQRVRAANMEMGRRNPNHASHLREEDKETARRYAEMFARPNEYAEDKSRAQQHQILQSINARQANITADQLARSDPMACSMPLAVWSPCRTPDFAWKARRHRRPSLTTLAIACLVENLAHVDSLGPHLPDRLKMQISAAVCARNKMEAHVLPFFFCDAPAVVCIPNCTLIQDFELINVFKGFRPWQQLEELHLGFCGRPFSDECAVAFMQQKKYYNLKAITLHAAYRLTDKGLTMLLNATPRLLHLNLGQCPNLTNVGIQGIAFHTHATLESLVVEDCGRLNAHEFVPNLLTMHNLHTLSLARIDGVHDDLVEKLTLGIGSQLKELSLAECSNLTDVSISRIATRCPLLKTLNLKKLTRLTDIGLDYITTHSTMMLEVLDVTMCKFSDEAVATFVSNLGGSLENLSVNHVNEVADHTLMALSKSSHASLKRLDVCWCRKMSDDCLGFLVSACPHLIELRLIACTQVTARFLEGHNNARLKLVV